MEATGKLINIKGKTYKEKRERKKQRTSHLQQGWQPKVDKQMKKQNTKKSSFQDQSDPEFIHNEIFT